jgi:hypothetical protein
MGFRSGELAGQFDKKSQFPSIQSIAIWAVSKGRAILLKDPTKNAMATVKFLEESKCFEIPNRLLNVDSPVNKQKATFIANADHSESHQRQRKLDGASSCTIVLFPMSTPNPSFVIFKNEPGFI